MSPQEPASSSPSRMSDATRHKTAQALARGIEGIGDQIRALEVVKLSLIYALNDVLDTTDEQQ